MSRGRREWEAQRGEWVYMYDILAKSVRKCALADPAAIWTQLTPAAVNEFKRFVQEVGGFCKQINAYVPDPCI